MDRFFTDLNLARLRSLASAPSDAERKTLLDLLAVEKIKFIDLHKAGRPPRLESRRDSIPVEHSCT
jgi:hypothetical protein